MFPEIGPDELPDLPTSETEEVEEDFSAPIPLGYNPDTGEIYQNPMSDPDVRRIYDNWY